MDAGWILAKTPGERDSGRGRSRVGVCTCAGREPIKPGDRAKRPLSAAWAPALVLRSGARRTQPCKARARGTGTPTKAELVVRSGRKDSVTDLCARWRGPERRAGQAPALSSMITTSPCGREQRVGQCQAPHERSGAAGCETARGVDTRTPHALCLGRHQSDPKLCAMLRLVSPGPLPGWPLPLQGCGHQARCWAPGSGSCAHRSPAPGATRRFPEGGPPGAPRPEAPPGRGSTGGRQAAEGCGPQARRPGAGGRAPWKVKSYRS